MKFSRILVGSVIGVCLLATSVSSHAAGKSYFQPSVSEEPVATRSEPIIRVYIGRAKPVKETDRIRGILFECPADKIDFSTFDNGAKQRVSAAVVDHNGLLQFNGKFNKDEQSFDVKKRLNHYFYAHIKGEVVEDKVYGSIWYTVKNAGGYYNKEGLCVSNFTAKLKEL